MLPCPTCLGACAPWTSHALIVHALKAGTAAAAPQIFKKWLSSETQHDLVCSFNNTEIRQCSLCCGMSVSSKASRRTVNLTKICEAHRSSVALCRPSSQSLWKGAPNSSPLPMTRVQTWEYIDIVEDSLLKEWCGFTQDPLFYVTYT